MGEDLFYRRHVSRQHLDILAHFMVRYPSLALARARSREGTDQARKMWEKIAKCLNKIDPKVIKSGRNWCKYWYDVKFKIRRKYSCLKKCEADGIQCTVNLNPFERKMVQVLTDKDGNLLPSNSAHHNEMQSLRKMVQCDKISKKMDHKPNEINAYTDISENYMEFEENSVEIEESNLEDDYLLPATEHSATEGVIRILDSDMKSNIIHLGEEKDPIQIEGRNIEKLNKELLEFELEEHKELFEIAKRQRREKRELKVSRLGQEKNPIQIEKRSIEDLKKELLEFELAKQKELFAIEKRQSREKHELVVSILRLKKEILLKEVKKL